MTAPITLPVIEFANGAWPHVFEKVQADTTSGFPQSPTTSANTVSGPPFCVASARNTTVISSPIGSSTTPGKSNSRFVSPCCSKSIAVAPDETMLLDRYVTSSQPVPNCTRTWMPSASVVSELSPRSA